MAAQRVRSVSGLVFIIVILALTLGFHWLWFGRPGGHRLCVVPKDQLGFKDTFLSAGGQIDLVFEHPILASRIAGGRGWCLDL